MGECWLLGLGERPSLALALALALALLIWGAIGDLINI